MTIIIIVHITTIVHIITIVHIMTIIIIVHITIDYHNNYRSTLEVLRVVGNQKAMAKDQMEDIQML
jgi:hypothetical protein